MISPGPESLELMTDCLAWARTQMDVLTTSDSRPGTRQSHVRPAGTEALEHAIEVVNTPAE